MAHIRVLETYIGRVTNGRRIDPGVYEEGAPQLFGAEDILVAKGKAQRFGSAPAVEQGIPESGQLALTGAVGGEEITPEPTEEELRAKLKAAYGKQDKTVLKALADQRGLTITPTGTNGGELKDDVINALVDADIAAKDEAPPSND